jgi:hypothetical protein
MISKQYIKDLEFKNIEDIFNYIVDSEINGNFMQFKELINKLSKEQFKEFLFYIDGFQYLNNHTKEHTIFKDKVLKARF